MQSDLQYPSTSLAVGGSDLDDHMNDMAGAGWELVTMAVEHATGDDLPGNIFHLIWRRQFGRGNQHGARQTRRPR